jgi:hypothetical protein
VRAWLGSRRGGWQTSFGTAGSCARSGCACSGLEDVRQDSIAGSGAHTSAASRAGWYRNVCISVVIAVEGFEILPYPGLLAG